MKDILKNIFASIISAILITIIFTSWSDSEFKEYNLTGKWNLKTVTNNANLDAYKNMELFYYVHIIQSNNEIMMTAEKVKENSVRGGTIEYSGKNRTLLQCKGVKTYNYFSKNKLVLNCEETGKERKSTMILDLDIKLNNKISGTFLSSASDSDGTIEIVRSKS
jgi:hypothetical protein